MAWELIDRVSGETERALTYVEAAGVLVLARDPVNPWLNRDIVLIEQPTRFADVMQSLGIDPAKEITVLMINGEFYARAEWPDVVLKPGDRAALMWLPAGGGGRGSQMIMGVVMIIVGAILYAYGGATLMQVGVAMMVGGTLNVVTALLTPQPKIPTVDAANSLAAPSPTYSLQAQGNYARLGQPIPSRYGRTRAFPDFGAQPWAEYVGNEQYLYELFVLGQGEYDIETVQIEDQPLVATLGGDGIWRSESPFSDISWQIVPPGGTVTYFPVRLLISQAVAQQELLTNTSIGPFQITDAEIDRIGVDVVCPQGMYYANDAGGLDAKTITFKVYATPLVQSGAAWIVGGAEVLLATETITEATTTPQRRSYSYAVAQGRYQVRLVRTDAKDTSSRAGHTINWVGLRGYVPGLQQYGNVTCIAMRARASDQLSSQSSRKINVICTRKLPTWNPATGWSLPTATRSIAWAFADVLRNDQYGAGQDDTSLPLQDLYDLETNVWKSILATGDTFDHAFDRAMVVIEALNHIVRAGRAMWYQRGPDFILVRDQARTVPTALFNMRNIERGSFKLNFKFDDEDTADSVQVTYWDEQIWAYDTFDCVPPGFTSNNPAQITIAGVQRRAQAAALGHYFARANRHRRIYGSFRTELEGRVVKPGDLIAVSHDLLESGLSAEVVSYTGTGKAVGDILTLSEPTEWATGNHYIALSTRRGGFSGPWRVTSGADAYKVVLAEAITDAALTLYTGGSQERTRVTFGPGDNYAARVLVIPPLRMKGNAVEISFVEDSPEVYDETGVSVPSVDQPFDLPLTIKPVVKNLFVTLVGNTAAPMLDLSWESSGNPSYHLVETSDNGVNYTRIAEPTSASCRIPVKLGAVWVRIAAVGSVRGDWVIWSGNTSNMMTKPSNVANLRLAQPVTGQPTQWNAPDAEFLWDAAARADAYRIEIWQGGVKRGEYQRTDARFTYTFAANKADGGPRRAFDIKVYGLNSGGESAAAATLSVSNPQLTACVIAAQQSGDLLILSASLPSAGTDWAGTRFVISTNSAADPNSLAVWSDGPGFMGQAPVAAGTYYAWGAQYDSFGVDSLTWSPRVTIVKTAGAQGLPTLTAIPANPAAIGGQLAFFYDVAEATGQRGLWGWDGSAWKHTRSGAYLVVNSVTADRMQVSALSAISANLGGISAGTIELVGSGWNYLRSGAKWASDGVDGFVLANNAGTGVAGLEFKAGNNLFRMGPSGWGGSLFQMADGSGNIKMKLDTVNNSFQFLGDLDVKSAASGARMEIKNSVIKVFDSAGVKRVQLGDLSA